MQPPLARAGIAAGPLDDLHKEGHGVHAKARRAQRQPEPDSLGDLVADARVGDVEVGLERRELVLVVLRRRLLPRPVLLRGAVLAGGIVRPDVVVAEGTATVRARGLKPWVPVRRVV